MTLKPGDHRDDEQPQENYEKTKKMLNEVTAK